MSASLQSNCKPNHGRGGVRANLGKKGEGGGGEGGGGEGGRGVGVGRGVDALRPRAGLHVER